MNNFTETLKLSMTPLHILGLSQPKGIIRQMLTKNSNTMLKKLTELASMIPMFMLIWTMFRQFIPHELRSFLKERFTHLYSYFHPYIEVTIPERSGKCLRYSEAYTTVQSYLSSISSKSSKRFMGEIGRDGKSMTLSMDKYERVEDEYKGVKVWWVSGIFPTATGSDGVFPTHHFSKPEKRFYRVTFHQKHRDLVTEKYLKYVIRQGKEIRAKNRQRILHTNVGRYSFGKKWSHIPFEHPATFETLAMDSDKKKEIMDDLETFSKSKNFYARIGKAWKRGYLLYGPPGTGKSTMIAAMANFLKYDVYDLELTAVSDNTDLRRLLIETTSNSIIVIEDIDCTLHLTGQRKKNEEKMGGDQETENKDLENEGDKATSNVTLSGLLNFIDGIWSSCGGEKIIVFTTNHVEKLDPALIRSGRMDKHIEMSYCTFEGFKVLAKNYLFLKDDDDDHNEMFEVIKTLLSKVKITPADVAENLMPKSSDETAETCLQKLIVVLQEAKRQAAKERKQEKKSIEDLEMRTETSCS